MYIQNENKIDENILNYLYRYQIYISGEIANCDNSKIKSYLEDNYDLMCYNSKIEDVDKVKLVTIMGSSIMIVMYQINNEIQNQEINTARILKIPILFIFNSEEDKQRDSVNQGENRIVFKNLGDIEMILKERFKLIKKLKQRKNLPFKTFEQKTE